VPTKIINKNYQKNKDTTLLFDSEHRLWLPSSFFEQVFPVLQSLLVTFSRLEGKEGENIKFPLFKRKLRSNEKS
jgi:hypothetical protein